MNLWGATPLIAAALLTGGTGAHAMDAHHIGLASATAPSFGLPGTGARSLALQQLELTRWQATVLLNDTGPAVTPSVPARNVTLTDYLGIPAITGSIITILSLVLSVLLVRRSGRKRSDRKSKSGYAGIRDWLESPILGSGAWTANDSWATNISTGLVVVGAVLGATTATNTLFPGVPLDRFSIANIAAGFFVVAAPVVFGILYSQFTAKNPGLTADATVRLPSLQAATVSVPSGASITMAADTTILDGSARWAIVRGGGTYQIPPGTKIQVLAGIQAAAQAWVQAAELVVADVLAQAVANASVEAAALASADADAPSVQHVVELALAQAGVYTPAGRIADEFEKKIRHAVEDAVHDSVIGLVVVSKKQHSRWRHELGHRRGVQGRADAIQAAVQAGIAAAAVAGGAQTDVTGLQAGILALTLAIEQAIADVATERGILDGEQSADQVKQAIMTSVPKAKGVRRAAQKVVQDAADAAGRPARQRLFTEGTQSISDALEQPDLPIDTAGVIDTMAYSGGADIGVLPGSTLQINASAGTWTIQSSDVLAQTPSPPVPPARPGPHPAGVHLVQLVPPTPPATPDAPLAKPVLIDPTGGAKITVTGAADTSLPKGAVISAPRRPCYRLPRNRELLAPQGTDLIVANLRMILIVNIFTMFGIGAELGIAAVLAGFSNATGHGRGYIFLALAAVAVLVVLYAATATRMMADPQPGSSLSSRAGTSFTL
jgi:hypothetical protein